MVRVPRFPRDRERISPAARPRDVRFHPVGSLLGLLEQGLEVGVEFGTHSLEALLWVAESIEEGVYEPGSLTRTADGLRFALDNPPLRVGAFASLRLLIAGVAVPAERIRIRASPSGVMRTAETISRDRPLDLAPGDRTEFDVAGSFGPAGTEVTIRVELVTPAVPPPVWLEFHDAMAPERPNT